MGERRFDAVFFDVGNTLAWTEPTPEAIFAQALEEHGYVVTDNEGAPPAGDAPAIRMSDIIRAGSDTAAHFQPPYPRDMEGQLEFFQEFNGMVVERLGVPASDEIVESLGRRFADPVPHVFDDVHEVLGRLADDGYRLGVISNAAHDITGILDTLDLTRYFDAVTYSWEAGAEKPDPEIFRIAMRRLGVEASRAVHVGDIYEKDVVGARAAGLTAVLIDREGRTEREDCTVVSSLSELLHRSGGSGLP